MLRESSDRPLESFFCMAPDGSLQGNIFCGPGSDAHQYACFSKAAACAALDEAVRTGRVDPSEAYSLRTMISNSPLPEGGERWFVFVPKYAPAHFPSGCAMVAEQLAA